MESMQATPFIVGRVCNYNNTNLSKKCSQNQRKGRGKDFPEITFLA